MAVVINTNVDSLKIQNLLNASTTKMSESMQRMSSGLRIISAKDDAAGSVISARMKVQLNGNQIAQNNVQNANSMLSTAEGNIDVILENVSRIRDLTLQAKNGTYSLEERQAMQDEVAERVAEIDRVSKSSRYSQLDLFNNEELQTEGVTFQVGPNSTENDIIKASDKIFASVQFGDITTFEAIEPEIVVNEDDEWDTGLYKEKDADGSVTYKKVDEYEEGAIYAFTDNAGAVANKGWYVVDTADGASGPAGDELYLVSEDAPQYLDLADVDTDYDDALDKLDKAIDNLTARKSQIGSTQSRLDSALSALTTQNTNLSSAKSIITDANIGAEASAFTQNQILQQVSTSLLAQANQAPSVALSLI